MLEVFVTLIGKRVFPRFFSIVAWGNVDAGSSRAIYGIGTNCQTRISFRKLHSLAVSGLVKISLVFAGVYLD
jgi:hypothetical protein